MDFSWRVLFFVVVLGSSIYASNLVFGQPNQTNSSGSDCLYSIIGTLSYTNGSCDTKGTPTILSQVNGTKGFGGLLAYDIDLYTRIVWYPQHYINYKDGKHHTLDLSNFCQYDAGGNFKTSVMVGGKPLTEIQKNVLLDLQANYTVYICPFTGNPTPVIVPDQNPNTIITSSGTINVMDLGTNTPSNSTIPVSNQTMTPTNQTMSDPSTDVSKILGSPLQQFESGVPAKYTLCTEGFQLMLKSENHLPICVKPQTAQKLVERGWTESVVSQIPVNTTQVSCKDQNVIEITHLAEYNLVKSIVVGYPPIKKIIEDSSYCEMFGGIASLNYGNGTVHAIFSVNLNNTKNLNIEIDEQTKSVVAYHLYTLWHSSPPRFDIEAICKVNGGQWDENYRECVGISNQTCQVIHGDYTFCTSACRHVQSEVCTENCVQVCAIK